MPSLDTIIDRTSLAHVGLTADTVSLVTKRNDSNPKPDADDSAAASNSDEGTRASISERGRELSAGDQRRIAELQRIDTEVRAHEQAHISAGRGVITSGPTYTYTYGPDGRQYAVSGEVGIDTSPERKPQANIDKGRRIQDAALAPAQPSPQDYEVAASGSQLEAQGRSDLAADMREQEIEQAQAAEDQRQAQLEATREQQQAQEAAATQSEAAPGAPLSPSPAQTDNTAAAADEASAAAAAHASAPAEAAAESEDTQAAVAASSASQAQAYVQTAQPEPSGNGVSVYA